MAQLCQRRCRSLHAAAVRFYTDAFADQPKLQAQHRYNAACAAALAGTADAGKLIGANDDIAPNNLNARIFFTPKEDGLYRIIATSFEQRGRGAYTVTVRAVGK